MLRNIDDESSLIEEIDASDHDKAMEAAQGRMKVKVETAVKAVEHGVGRVIFADGRTSHPVSDALAGKGTVVRKSVAHASERIPG